MVIEISEALSGEVIPSVGHPARCARFSEPCKGLPGARAAEAVRPASHAGQMRGQERGRTTDLPLFRRLLRSRLVRCRPPEQGRACTSTSCHPPSKSDVQRCC